EPCAMSLGDGKLTPFVEETVTHDDNVFRIPGNFSPPAAGPRGDTYYTTAAGFSFDVPVSRQRFQGGYTWSDVRYHHYSDFDYTGHDGRAIWLWQLGNDASGQLGYTDTTAPAS